MSNNLTALKSTILASCGLVLAGISFFDEAESRQILSENKWPSVNGRIITKRMQGSCPQITYEYNVAGTDHTSNTVRLGFLQSRSCTDDDYAKLSPGQQVKVWYKSDDPDRSYVVPAYDDRARIWAGIGGALILLALVMRRN